MLAIPDGEKSGDGGGAVHWWSAGPNQHSDDDSWRPEENVLPCGQFVVCPEFVARSGCRARFVSIEVTGIRV